MRVVPRRSSLRPALAAGALVLLVLAGCGRHRDDADAPQTTAAPTTATEHATTTATDPSSSAPTSTSPTSTAPTAAVDGSGVAAGVDPTGEVVHGELQTADGRTRTYRLYRPTHRAADAPLLVALHGGLGNGDQFAATSGYERLAEANGFVVVFPDGTPTAVGQRNLVWNGGGCCAAAVRNGVDDVGFLRTLIAKLGASEGIDPTRVLVTGHSNGAIMAFRLACEDADQVVAVAGQAGTLFVDSCRPSRPVSALDLHGTADTNLPLAGGVGADSLVGADFPPVRDGLATLAKAAGCTGPTPPTSRPTTQADVRAEDWGPCPDGVDVELVTVEGATHSWMGHPAPSKNSATPYPDLDATLLTWSFLTHHR